MLQKHFLLLFRMSNEKVICNCADFSDAQNKIQFLISKQLEKNIYEISLLNTEYR